jgi:PAS domain-containing protein
MGLNRSRSRSVFPDIWCMESKNVSLATSSDFGISVLNSLVDTIAVLDEHGIILAVNDAWRRFAVTNGTTSLSGDFVGQSYLRVCEQAIQNRTDTEAYAALQGLKAVLAGEVREFHLDYPCHATSEERWFHMRIIPFSTGTNRGAIVSHTNITPRIRADRALRKSQEQLKCALDATCDGLWDWDINSGTVHFSDQWLRLLGTITDITDRKNAEAAREEAVMRLEKLANRVPGVVYQFRKRPDGTYCMPFSSDRIRELLRVTPEQVREDASAAFVHVHPEDLGQLMQSIEQSAAELSARTM